MSPCHQRFFRVVLAAVGLIGLAVVTTVGVAWGCAAKARRIQQTPDYREGVVSLDRHGKMEYAAVVTRRCMGFETLVACGVPMVGMDPSERFDRPEDAGTMQAAFRQMYPNVGPLPLPGRLVGMMGDSRQITEFTLAGWPARCAFSRRVSAITTDDVIRVVESEFETLSWRGLRAPIGPLWPGLAVDTAFYAGAWWLILLAPRRVRHALRKRRGRCVRCGYDLAGLAPANRVCPECGAAA